LNQLLAVAIFLHFLKLEPPLKNPQAALQGKNIR